MRNIEISLTAHPGLSTVRCFGGKGTRNNGKVGVRVGHLKGNRERKAKRRCGVGGVAIQFYLSCEMPEEKQENEGEFTG